jgi:hypothetical protein
MNKTSKLDACSLVDPSVKATLIDISEAFFLLRMEMKDLPAWRRADLETACQSLIYARNELDAMIKELYEAVDNVEPWANAHLKN